MGLYYPIAFLFIFSVLKSQSVDQSTNIGCLQWSADGQKLVFTAMRCKTDYSDYSPDKWKMYLFEISDEKVHLLDHSVIRGSISPNGKMIVYSKNIEGNWEIVKMNLKNRSTKNISKNAARDAAPFFHPRSRKLLFCSDRAGDTEIYEMKLSGRILRKLKTDDSGKKFNPEYSPDGRRVVFYVEKGDNKDQIHLMDLNSRDSKNLTQDNHHNYYPSWLDNDTILFVRLDESVWTIDSHGNNCRRLVLPPTEIVRIGPGLNQLTFVNSDAESIVVLDRRSGEQRVLLTSKDLPAN